MDGKVVNQSEAGMLGIEQLAWTAFETHKEEISPLETLCADDAAARMIQGRNLDRLEDL